MFYQPILHIQEVLLMKHNLGARSAVDLILYSGAKDSRIFSTEFVLCHPSSA